MSNRKYRNYTDQDIINAVKLTRSIAGLLRALGLAPCGGNYTIAKRNLQRLNIDTSHWTGQGWNKGSQLKDWKNYKRSSNLKQHLIKSRGHQCEKCLLVTWLETTIMLEIHHVDGNNTNNDYDNLQLLCPNCHSLTDTWRGRNIK